MEKFNRLKVTFKDGSAITFDAIILEFPEYNKIMQRHVKEHGSIVCDEFFKQEDFFKHPTCSRCFLEAPVVDCSFDYPALCEKCAIEVNGEEALSHIISLRLQKKSFSGLTLEEMETAYMVSGFHPKGTIIYRHDAIGYYEIVVRSNVRRKKQIIKCVLFVNGVPTIPMYRVEWNDGKNVTHNVAKYDGTTANWQYRDLK